MGNGDRHYIVKLTVPTHPVWSLTHPLTVPYLSLTHPLPISYKSLNRPLPIPYLSLTHPLPVPYFYTIELNLIEIRLVLMYY